MGPAGGTLYTHYVPRAVCTAQLCTPALAPPAHYVAPENHTKPPLPDQDALLPHPPTSLGHAGSPFLPDLIWLSWVGVRPLPKTELGCLVTRPPHRVPFSELGRRAMRDISFRENN